MPLDEFIERVASDSPTPGGGSVSALASSLGCALVEMVSKISLKKSATDELKAALEQSENLRRTLTDLIEEDARAYQVVVDAYTLPKGSEEEMRDRSNAIQDALVGAAEPPLRIMKASLRGLEIAKLVAEEGSKSTCSDVGVAALLAQAGLHGGHLNVMINLASVRNEELKERMAEEARSALEVGTELLQRTLAIVDSRLQ
jgi:glutamate formiminotransferase/formiminotetrahydrofolate cyclodeaminase